MSTLTAMWTLLAIVLGVVEAATMGLVCIWFCIAAIISAVISLFVPAAWIQFAVFVLVSAVLLATTKSAVKRLMHNKPVPTNADAVIGREGIVIVEINSDKGTGQIKVGGQIWSARADSDIAVNERVTVTGISGVKTTVEKI